MPSNAGRMDLCDQVVSSRTKYALANARTELQMPPKLGNRAPESSLLWAATIATLPVARFGNMVFPGVWAKIAPVPHRNSWRNRKNA